MNDRFSWWNNLRHGGLLLDAPRLTALIPGEPEPLTAFDQDRLRRRLTRFRDDAAEHRGALVSFVLETVCGCARPLGEWYRGSEVKTQWSRRAITGESVRPRQLWLGQHGATLPVFVDDQQRIGVELDDRNAMVRHFKKLARFLEGKDLAKRIEEDPSWFDGTKQAASVTAQTLPFRRTAPTPGERYRTCVPLIALQAAAGGFGSPASDLPADSEWVQIQSKHRLRTGMFVARVTGKSMEPQVPDGAYGLFHGPVEGSRDGKVVLVRLRDQVDPETGERFTLKRYRSAKQEAEDGTWRHKTITLCPVNPDFQPIVLASDDDGRIDVVAELIEVLG